MFWHPQPEPPAPAQSQGRRASTPRPSGQPQRRGTATGARPSLDIVVSRGPPTPWQDPALEWAQELSKTVKGGARLQVYGKSRNDNRGGVCSAYLKHIVDNYDNLPDFIFFIKDEEWSWTHTGSIKERFLEAISSQRRYFNINDAMELPSVYNSPHVSLIEQWYTDHIDKWIPFSQIPDPDWATGYRGGNQFLVHKTLIQELPKQFYEEMYRWVMTCGIPSQTTDEMLETTWHLFFVIWPRMQAEKRRQNKLADLGYNVGQQFPSSLPPVV